MKKRQFGFFCMTFLLMLLLFPAGRVKAEPEAYHFLLPEADTRVYSEAELGAMPLQVVCFHIFGKYIPGFIPGRKIAHLCLLIAKS